MTDEKTWYESRTIWGALIAVAASFLSMTGISLDAQMQSELADIVIQAVGAVGALMAIYGRLSATRVIA